MPAEETRTEQIAKGKNSFNSNDWAINNASLGFNKPTNLLSQGTPRKPIKIEGTAKKIKGKVIDLGDS